ncbi:MAG TPA: lysylphosphatidylglycerol synthase domain-containing protein [Acidimicrobiia bacterium]
MTEEPLSPKRRLTWWQLVFPVLVLIVLFGVVLPKYIDYEDVWQEITALDGASLLLLTLLGIISSWTEAAIYTSLIPGLSYRAGWKAFLGGNTVAGFAPSPWDIVVRYAMYRGFGVDGSIAGASVIVGGGFQIMFAIMAPVLVLVYWVATGEATQTGRVLTALAVAAITGAVLIVALILRRERIAVRIGNMLQRAADWVFPKLKRPAPPDVVGSTVGFRRLLLRTLASRWWISALFLLTMHVIRYFGMLYLFREVGITARVVSASELLAVYAIGIMMSLMPIVPAGLGVVELTYVWLLAPDDPSLADQIAAATFTHRIFFWLLPIVIGIFPLVGWIRRGGGSMVKVAQSPDLTPT